VGGTVSEDRWAERDRERRARKEVKEASERRHQALKEAWRRRHSDEDDEKGRRGKGRPG
jgi:hypothetical protein